MANYTDSKSNVAFNDVKAGGKKQSSSPVWTGVNGVDEFGGIVNVIDVDWNGAQLGAAIQALSEVPDNGALNTATITTTGELIKVIAKQQKQIDALIVMMKALYGTFTTP